ncbi:hypothetical protein GCM10011519_20830 [Marmoricola endophyticus]|uniref:Uncharacterized protein n=1 Tax=Marmoricola endophyticus TaxID=2040280 RepID=A0A917BIC1_9ACTN|nr:hypothetical protein [Marmoricola endophyticus]GGF46686.1 hypothetical protein GCM10011519_20830 [Marmoricola endophyticus]
MSAATGPARTSSPGTLRALQVFAVLTVVNLAWQFVTAGRLFPGPVDLHATGAIVLHVVSGFAAVAAGAHWYRTRTSPWPGVIAVIVFVYTFVQAATGDRMSLAVHIPGAMALVVGAVWVALWSFGRSPRL